MSSADGAYEWAMHNELIATRMNGKGYYLFTDVENAILSMLPKNFPIMDNESGIKYKDALLVTQLNFFQSRKATYSCMFQDITVDLVNDELGSRLQHGRESLFSRFDFTEPDGSPIKITSHQLRHWLNTIAQRGGLSQLDIAKWSGRKDIHQNANYDHMTAYELIEKVRSIDDPESRIKRTLFGAYPQILQKQPISGD